MLRTTLRKTAKQSVLLMVVCSLPLLGCDLDVQDEANPGIEDLIDSPTRSNVTAATTGLLIGSRGNMAQANGYVSQLGILGRESYNFDPSDPRYVEELIVGDLNSGSPFGGNFWAGPYRNIRAVHIVTEAAPKVTEFSPAELAGINGFAKTIQVLDLLEIITTRDTNGIVIDTNREIGDVGAIVSPTEALTFVASLLDEANTDLGTAGDAFAFPLSTGFAGFDTPATFATFNRALRARVAAYQADHQGILDALAGSFIDDTDPSSLALLNTGVSYSFSLQPGDLPNNLLSPNIFVHPSVRADAQAGPNIDTRIDRKIVAAEEAGSVEGRTAEDVFTAYSAPTTAVPIIRNEDLILLRAEANLGLNMLQEAEDDINLIRFTSGELAAVTLATAQEVEDELLYNRRYSLLFEGGHRLIDLRRFGRIDNIPLDIATDKRNQRFPIPLPECNARPGEPACALGSN